MPDTTTFDQTHSATPSQSPLNDREIAPVPDLIDYAKEYARQKPEVAALWCLGIGFVLGWKLKPW